MKDLAKFPIQNTLTVQGCPDEAIETLLDEFVEVCSKTYAAHSFPVEVYREEFKTANTARKIGGVIGFAAKLAQKSSPGFAIESKENEYALYLVASQYRDEVSFDIYHYTPFKLRERTNRKQYEYCGNKYLQAQNYLLEAWQSLF